jgi:hypothetical protein
MRALLTAASIVVALFGCSKPAPTPAPPSVAQAAAPSDSAPADLADPSFIGRVWMSSKLRAPRGSMLVFLPDKTLLMDSCFETYRLSKWGIVGEDRIRWIEDTIPIEAQVIVEGEKGLRLRIAGREEDETYFAASVPYICPDMPR